MWPATYTLVCVAGGSVGVGTGYTTTPGRISAQRGGSPLASSTASKRLGSLSAPSQMDWSSHWVEGASRCSPRRQAAIAASAVIQPPSSSSRWFGGTCTSSGASTVAK